MRKIVFITGATSGIGEATAHIMAENGWNLVITGRRASRLQRLKNELESSYGVQVLPLSFDIRDRYQCCAAVNSLNEEFRDIDVLVNNAGLALGMEHIDQGDLNDWEGMIDTNIKGLLFITQKIASLMVARKKGGHIINIGSIAGTQPYEKGAVYSATKHAVHALSQGMRIDLRSHKIKVTEVRPGMVETEFSVVRFHGDDERADQVYDGVEPLTGDDVAEAVLWAVNQPAHVNIDEILMTPLCQANAYYVHREKRS